MKKWHLAHTVIKSNRRYAYEEVQQLLEDNGVKDGTGEPAPPATKKNPYKGEYANELIKLDALAKKLRAARFKNGSVKFDREELHFDIDEKGKPVKAYFKVSKDANKLIEEFMLLANKTVAESIGRVKKGQKAKTLPYRIHDQPDPQKLENLRQFVSKFGYKVKTSGTKGAITKSLNALMADAEGTREQNAIETVALRAMMKAKYSVHNIGHYGLAFDYYTHFTSPIRRYPDMMVHRLLRISMRSSVSIAAIWNRYRRMRSATVSSIRWWSLWRIRSAIPTMPISPASPPMVFTPRSTRITARE